jgi:hypothetical protein
MFEDDNATPDSAPQSMDDTLSAAFDALNDDSQAADNDEPSASRERDDRGRFASKQAEAEENADSVDADDAKPEEEAQNDAKQPPSSWRANVREHFATLAPEVQDEILRREADFHKGIEQYRVDADYGRSLKQVLAPYQQDFAALGVDESRAVGTLLGYERTLRLGSPEQKLEIFQSMARSYGVPVEALLSDDGEVQQAAMLNAQLTSRLNQLEQQLHGFTSQQQSQVQAQVSDTITKFASDPANKWFNDVKEDMGRLLQSNMATDLKDAYEKACNMRPDIRAAIAAQQQREADEKRQKEAAQRMVQAKKAASVNVRQSGPKPMSSNAPRTIDQTLAETFDRIQAS